MKKGFEIRALRRSDDMSQLVALSYAFFKEYESHHDYFFQTDTLKDEQFKNYFCSWFDRDDRIALVAVIDNRIIAYLTIGIKSQEELWEIKRVGHISGLMVEQSMRRQGIARALFREAMAFLKERGVKYYTLFTSSNNNEAIAFYKKCGMTSLYTHLLGNAEDTLKEINKE